MAQWSHSRLETHRSCPRKFFYRYIERVKLPSAPETLAQFLGKRVHEAFEKLYGDLRSGVPPTLDGVLAGYRERWDAEWHDGVMLPDERAPEVHRAQGEGWVGDYFNRHAPFADTRTIDIEARVRFSLDDEGRHQWIGYIDRIARTSDGTWQIHDYKTNRTLPTQQDMDQNPQLAYYEIGIRRMWPADVKHVELTWHFVAFDTSITSTRTSEQLNELRAHAIEAIDAIEVKTRQLESFPTNETYLCGYCEFQEICPVRKHLFEVKQLPPSRFASEPGVKLVDHWAELDERRKAMQAEVAAIESEIDEVKAALQGYAEEHELEVVTGAEREATVKHTEKVQFPRKSEPSETDESLALEQQLRASPWWQETSALDRFALDRLYKTRDSKAADLRALLEEFGHVREQVDVRLRKKKG